MTDLGKGRSGPKESDNRDKSLHGLMVALAMAGAIPAWADAAASAPGNQPAGPLAHAVAAATRTVAHGAAVEQ